MSKFYDLINGNKPVLVDFYADWCQPCKIVSPTVAEIARELGDRIKVIKVNVDNNPAVSAKYGIRGIPTLILFKNGQILWRQSGAVPKEYILRGISPFL